MYRSASGAPYLELTPPLLRTQSRRRVVLRQLSVQVVRYAWQKQLSGNSVAVATGRIQTLDTGQRHSFRVPCVTNPLPCEGSGPVLQPAVGKCPSMV